MSDADDDADMELDSEAEGDSDCETGGVCEGETKRLALGVLDSEVVAALVREEEAWDVPDRLRVGVEEGS